jgi:hypothetical protein
MFCRSLSDTSSFFLMSSRLGQSPRTAEWCVSLDSHFRPRTCYSLGRASATLPVTDEKADEIAPRRSNGAVGVGSGAGVGCGWAATEEARTSAASDAYEASMVPVSALVTVSVQRRRAGDVHDQIFIAGARSRRRHSCARGRSVVAKALNGMSGREGTRASETRVSDVESLFLVGAGARW